MPSDIELLRREEERKRKAAEAKRLADQAAADRMRFDSSERSFVTPTPKRSPLGVGAAANIAPAPAGQPSRGMAGPKGLADAPSVVFKDGAQQARSIMGQRSQKVKSPLDEFHYLRNQIGEEALQARFEHMTALSKAYLGPASSPEIVWDLVKLPYTTSATEYFLSRVNEATYGKGKTPVTRNGVRTYGLDPQNPDHVTLAGVGDAFERLTPMPFRPLIPVAKAAVEAGRIMAAGGSTGQVLTAGLGGSVVGMAKAAGDIMKPIEMGFVAWENRTQAHAKALLDAQESNAYVDMALAADPFKRGTLLTTQNQAAKGLVQSMEGVSAYVYNAKGDDLDPLLAEIQKDRYDLGGKVIAEGQLKDVKPGDWTPEKRALVKGVLNTALQMEHAAAIQYQRQMREQGDADWYAPLDGDLNSPIWQASITRSKRRLFNEAEAWEKNPELMYALQQGGLPSSWDDFMTMWRKTDENGRLQQAISVMLKAAIVPGQAQQAGLAGVNLSQRQNADPTWQKKVADLRAYMAGSRSSLAIAPFDPTAPVQMRDYDQNPLGPLQLSDAGVVLMAKTEFADDPYAQELLKSVNQETYRLIDQPHIVSFMDTFGRAFGVDGKQLDDYAKAHPDIVQATDVLTNVAIGLVSMKYPLGRLVTGTLRGPLKSGSVALAAGDRRIQTAVRNFSTELARGREGEAASVLGGTPEALQLAREAQQFRAGELVSKDMPEVTDLARELDLMRHAVEPEQAASRLHFKSTAEGTAFVDKLWAEAKRMDEGIPARRDAEIGKMTGLGLTEDEALKVLDGSLSADKAAELSVLRRRPGKKTLILDRDVQPLPNRVTWHRAQPSPEQPTHYHVGKADELGSTPGVDQSKSLGNMRGRGLYLSESPDYVRALGASAQDASTLKYHQASLAADMKTLDLEQPATGPLLDELIMYLEGEGLSKTAAKLEKGGAIGDVYAAMTREARGRPGFDPETGIRPMQDAVDNIIEGQGYQAKVFTDKGVAGVYEPHKVTVVFNPEQGKNLTSSVVDQAALGQPVLAGKAKQQVVTIKAIRTVDGERELLVRTARKGESGAIEEHWVKAADLRERGGADLQLDRRSWTPHETEKGVLRPVDRPVPTTEEFTVPNYGQVEPIAKRIAAAKARAEQTPTGWIAGQLAYRQRYRADIFGPEDVHDWAFRRITEAYAAGDDILPELRVNDLSGTSNARRELSYMLQNMPDSPVKTLLGARMGSWLTRAPMNAARMDLPDFIDVIGDSVSAITRGDQTIITKFKNLALNVKDPQGAARLAKGIDALAQEYLVMDSHAASGLMKNLQQGENVAGDVAYPTAMGVNPANKADVLGVYEKKGPAGVTVHKQAVPNPAMQSKQVNLPGRQKVLRAPLRLIESDGEALTLAQNLTNLSRRIRNVGRKGGVASTNVSNFARNVSVGSGAVVLAQKHTVADIGVRTAAHEPKALLWRRHAKLYDADIAEMSAETADRSAMYLHLTQGSEEHFITERGDVVGYTPKLAYDKAGKPTNLHDVSAAMRLSANEPIFRAYVTGGEEAIRAWFKTPEGDAFLTTSDLMGEMKAVFKEMGKPVKQLRAATIDHYIDKYMTALYEPWEVAHPRLYARMAEHARAGRNFSTEDITTMIKDVNKGRPMTEWENPALSLPVREGGGIQSAFVWMTKKGMTPNRAARTITYKAVFHDVYKSMRKEGIDPDKAGKAAATAAYLKTSDIHFDLSQATTFEQKYRYLVWFGTKHRLWATWLVKTGWKAPALGAAVVDFQQWMEDRSARNDVPEYYKYSITFPNPFGAGTVAVDMKPYLWLTEYPAGSTIEAALEQVGALSVNAGLRAAGSGVELHAAPTPFGASIVRPETLVREIARLASSPWGLGAALGTDQEAVFEWMKVAFPGRNEMEKFNKQIARTRQFAEVNGQELSTLDAIQNTLVGRAVTELLKFGKPVSTHLITPAETEIEKAKKQFEEADDGQGKADVLAANPWLGYAWNLVENPFEKADRDAAFAKYRDMEEEAAVAINHLWELGQLTDKEKVAAIHKQRMDREAELVRAHPAWGKFYEQSGEQDLMRGLGIILPLADLEDTQKNLEDQGAFLPEGTVGRQTPEELAALLQTNYEEAAHKKGINLETDSAEPFVKLMKKMMVDDPLEAAKRGFTAPNVNEPSLSTNEKFAAKYLARGKDGLVREDAYKQMLHDEDVQALWLKGLKSGKVNKSAPLFSTLTMEERERMGWSGDPVNVQVWAQWSWERMQMNKEVKAYRDEKGMGKTASTKFATARMDAFNAWSDRLAAANPSWGKEYDFSQLSTRERFAELGYGKSPGWRAFLGVVDDFELALKTAVVPSTGQVGLASAAGGTAAKIEDDFTPVLQKLATDYSEWFDEFSRSYSLTNFGFTKRWMQSLDEEWWAAKAPRMEEPAYTADDMWDPNL